MSNNVFSNSKWIWPSKEYGINNYAEFCQKIDYNGGKVNVKFSVSGEYTLFVNGEYVSSIQYADFEHYKAYEDIDITPYLNNGENFICFLCVYWSESGMRWNTPEAGLIYEIENDGKTVAVSDENTPSRQSHAYLSGFDVEISSQLGYSFSYDAAKEDEWLTGKGDGFGKSVVLEKECNFVKRPIKTQVVEALRQGKPCGEKKNYIFDLGEEYVGFCNFSINSKTEQTIRVFYGELLKDGHVKKTIGFRNFRFDYKTKIGENVFTNHMLRLACRYIEIECEDEIDVDYIGILPQVYPTNAARYDFLSGLDKDIYKICLNTLKLSMLEHYVDCPWREQCLYAFDSRNQMLTGYYAYADGNFEYARANLLLMSKDDREDGLMSICFPSKRDLTIPSFCLYYVLAVKEYTQHSGDLTLAQEVFDKMVKTLNTFMNNRKDGLICNFDGDSRWNFFDWSDYADGSRYGTNGSKKMFDEDVLAPNCLLNAIAVIALRAFEEICNKLGRNNPFDGIKEEIKTRVNETFFDSQKGLYFVTSPEEDPTELVNSLCVCACIAEGERAMDICEKLSSNTLSECSLSMKGFKYDALLMTDEKYRENVLSEIRDTYKVMLDAGSTTVWETKEGESAFASAGSLCHGWSAMPVYYYNILLK